MIKGRQINYMYKNRFQLQSTSIAKLTKYQSLYFFSVMLESSATLNANIEWMKERVSYSCFDNELDFHLTRATVPTERNVKLWCSGAKYYDEWQNGSSECIQSPCVCVYDLSGSAVDDEKKVGESEFSNVEIYYCYAYNFHLGSELGNASVIGRYSYDVILKLVKSKNAW